MERQGKTTVHQNFNKTRRCTLNKGTWLIINKILVEFQMHLFADLKIFICVLLIVNESFYCGLTILTIICLGFWFIGEL